MMYSPLLLVLTGWVNSRVANYRENRNIAGNTWLDNKSQNKIPYILESNPHPNLIRTSFCRFLKRKKCEFAVRGSPFLRPPLAYKAD